ncbi:MAG: quinate 5-dehydrogenase [Clostridia bacterium]|jgi:hypothetical protein
MKRIVSISIGSSSRDHRAEVNILGEDFIIERIGTDGDMKKAIQLVRELDGKVDAFGMGGLDLYLYDDKGKKYVLKSALAIAGAAKKTPIVDGSGLKNTLERRVVHFLHRELNISVSQKKVFLVCAMDRFGMAQAFETLRASVVYGDAMFALGVPFPIRSLGSLRLIARVLMPIVSHLPFEMLYPTGKSQEEGVPKYEEFYQWADIIAGDFLYIRKHMPSDLSNKIIVTNTVTQEDLQDLQSRGVGMLVTSTPEINGRSFGTNVMEAAFVSLLRKRIEDIKAEDYERLLDQLPSIHRVIQMDRKGVLTG